MQADAEYERLLPALREAGCRVTGTISCVPATLAARGFAESSFPGERHPLGFFGTCATCRDSQAVG